MSSPTNKINHSFASILPSIHKQKQGIEPKRNWSQLNNEGCRCEMCQKVIIHENMKILSEEVRDLESEQFSKDTTKQYFVKLIEEICERWKYKRSVRFCLPQTCIFKDAHPYALIQKKKQTSLITINKSKSRLHFFQIQNFFLTGYISHSPTKKPRQSKNQAICKPYINECIIFAKYEGNFYRMLTYRQIEALFQSKNKAMKDGLMYLQTVAGGEAFLYRTVAVRLDDVQQSEEMKALFERAKSEVKIIIGEIKLTDVQYFEQSVEIEFQNDLKNFDINRYLLYLSYKIILTSSKLNPQIITNAVFKYAVVEKKVYLFDVRVKQFGVCLKYWSSNVLQALEVKVKKTMSLMELEKSEKEERFKIANNNLSFKARNLSEWLKQSTEDDFEEMRIIRQRLQKLQQEKLSLDKSRKQQQMRKSFKLRNLKANKAKQRNDQKIVNQSLCI